MEATLFVDDECGLVDLIRDKLEEREIGGVLFATTIAAAREIISKTPLKRLVTDVVFEGEEFDGISLAAEAKRRRPNTDIVLISGKHFGEDQRRRARQIGVRVIRKAALSWSRVLGLLAGEMEPARSSEAEGNDEVDIAVLRLEREALEERLRDVVALNDELISDLLDGLQAIATERPRAKLLLGNSEYTITELRSQVTERTALGRELISLHLELNRALRRR